MPARSSSRDLGCLALVLVLGALGVVQDGPVPLLALVDLGLHELGHLVAYALPLGPLGTAAAGSVAQVAAPLGLSASFLLRAERTSAAVCLAWTATSLRSVATYVADAPDERLQLIGGEHDWAAILGPDGLDALHQAGLLAAHLRAWAWLLLAVAVATCARSLVAPVLARRGAQIPRAMSAKRV